MDEEPRMARQKPRTSRESDSAEAVKPLIVLVLLGTILYGGYSVVQKGRDRGGVDADLGPAPQAAEAPPFQPEVEIPAQAAAPGTLATAGPPVNPSPAIAGVPIQPSVAAASQPGPTYLSGREGPPPTAGQLMPDPPAVAPPQPQTTAAVAPPADLGAAMPAAFPGMDDGNGPALTRSPAAESAAARRSTIMAFTADWDEAHDQLAAGRYAEALALLSTWHDHVDLGVEESQRLEDLLGQLAGTVIYSQKDLLLPPHVVAPEETLESVAEPLGVSWQLLGKINGVSDPDSLIPGESLKVIRGPFDAEIGISRRHLVLRLTGNYAGSFPVAIGQAVAARTGESLAVSAILRGGPTNTSAPTTGIQRVSFESAEAAIELQDGLTIQGTDDPAALAQEPGPTQLLVSRAHLADLIDILMPGSRITIRP
jgi:LysM repeat protein